MIADGLHCRQPEHDIAELAEMDHKDVCGISFCQPIFKHARSLPEISQAYRYQYPEDRGSDVCRPRVLIGQIDRSAINEGSRVVVGAAARSARSEGISSQRPWWKYYGDPPKVRTASQMPQRQYP